MSDRLEGAARKAALAELHGWLDVPDADAIHKTFHFSSFREAWGFASQVALVAEKQDHHPEMIVAFDRVELRLTSHDVENANEGALTERDVALARMVDEFAPERDARSVRTRAPPFAIPRGSLERFSTDGVLARHRGRTR